MDRSDKIDELTKALIKASKDFGRVTKSSQGYNYKYADLAQVYEKVMPALLENGLVIIQSPISDGDSVGVQSMLAHESGQWVANKFTTRLSKMNPQDVGSALTYYRRYSVMALLGVAPEDDDGRAAMPKPPAPKPPVKEVFNPNQDLKSKLWREIQTDSEKQGVTKAEIREMMGEVGAKAVKDLTVTDLESIKSMINATSPDRRIQ